MSRVWIAQWSQFNFGQATRFGDLKPVIPDEFVEDINSSRIADMLRSFEDEFNPADDYLILTGEPMVMGMVFYVAASESVHRSEQERPTLNILRWNRGVGDYQPITIEV